LAKRTIIRPDLRNSTASHGTKQLELPLSEISSHQHLVNGVGCHGCAVCSRVSLPTTTAAQGAAVAPGIIKVDGPVHEVAESGRAGGNMSPGRIFVKHFRRSVV
ncbi:MAG: hypothetical protein NTY65_07020, partial [Planctomycetota bacterium]|nr:hypothetical protein [Planctomycetota bacterium]